MKRVREIVTLRVCTWEKKKKVVKEVKDLLKEIKAIIWVDSDVQVEVFDMLYINWPFLAFLIPCILLLNDEGLIIYGEFIACT